MCAVSMITDYYREKWPGAMPHQNPYVIPMADKPKDYIIPMEIQPHVYISAKEWEEYKKLKRIMETYDNQTGQPDCVKPEVETWEKVIEDIIKQQEKKNV